MRSIEGRTYPGASRDRMKEHAHHIWWHVQRRYFSYASENATTNSDLVAGWILAREIPERQKEKLHMTSTRESAFITMGCNRSVAALFSFDIR
jgi:hypothetical protein